MIKRLNVIFIGILVILIFSYCKSTHIPKPRGYYQINLPEHNFQNFQFDFPFSFDYSTYSNINVINSDSSWLNIEYPSLNGKIHLSYKTVNNNLSVFLEEAHMLAYKHSSKSDGISETKYLNNEKNVYGVMYDIKGNVASSVQFFLTDSIRNFIRGALYISVEPNKDSLAPVVQFFKEDIISLIESFNWR